MAVRVGHGDGRRVTRMAGVGRSVRAQLFAFARRGESGKQRRFYSGQSGPGERCVVGCVGLPCFEIEVYGNGERYNLHLRTADTGIVWQSYRASFEAPPRWQAMRLPFAAFQAHRIDVPLDLRRLKRMGLVTIGREFTADLCVARVGLYP